MFEQVETFGKYALLERLAVGGMAEIFRARIRGVSGVERVVAIKRIHRHLEQDEGLVQMLVDEARLTVRLQHPNVGQVFDIGCIDGQHFLVMEYISGVDMHRISRRIQEQQRHIPTSMVLYTMIELLAGLHYAHDLRGDDGELLHVVHRDISPQNVMFSMDGDVKLIDFGIAKARSQVMQTQAGIIKGKFYYMSPEQAHGQQLDRRCDVFAAGMLMYELVTGRPAYEELGDVALLRKVRACDFEPPSHWRKDLDPNLEAIIMKALKKDLRQRFQSAHDFRAALQHYAQHHFPPLTRAEASDFVRRLLDPEQVKQRTSRAANVMRRDDFSATEDSLIFDASHLARSIEAPAVDRNFADQLAENENPFATADEPTYVYTKEDENPFAIPDEITSPIQRAAPRRRKSNTPSPQSAPPARPKPAPAAPRHRPTPPSPPKKIKVGASVPAAPPQSIRISAEAPVYTRAESTDPAIVDDVTIPRKGLDLNAIEMPESYEPAYNPTYMPAFSDELPEGALGPREVTQITKPAVGSFQYGFRATEEADAIDRAHIMSAAPPVASGHGASAHATPSGPLAPLLELKQSLDASPHRSKILIAAGIALAVGILVPFLWPSDSERARDNIVALAPPDDPSEPPSPPEESDEPRHATLSIDTRPLGADVLLDGKFVGTTPKILNTVEVGTSPKITLRLDGHEIWEEEVLIQDTTPDPLSITLKEDLRDGVIVIETTPPGLIVRLDDEIVGKTPYTARDVDRGTSHTVLVTLDEGASRGKHSVVSWGEGDDREKVVDFDFGKAQGDSALPDAPEPDKVVTQKRTKTTRRQRSGRRKTTRRAPPKEDTSTKEDTSLDVWGNKTAASDTKKDKDTSLNVWGNKSKDSGGDAPGYLTVKVINGDGMIYVNGKLAKKTSPLSDYSLPPGKHKVYVRYTMLKRNSNTRTVTIRSGKRQRVTFSP